MWPQKLAPPSCFLLVSWSTTDFPVLIQIKLKQGERVADEWNNPRHCENKTRCFFRKAERFHNQTVLKMLADDCFALWHGCVCLKAFSPWRVELYLNTILRASWVQLVFFALDVKLWKNSPTLLCSLPHQANIRIVTSGFCTRTAHTHIQIAHTDAQPECRLVALSHTERERERGGCVFENDSNRANANRIRPFASVTSPFRSTSSARPAPPPSSVGCVM